eukprot:jgi/Chlat1/8781/Chrsp90S08116
MLMAAVATLSRPPRDSSEGMGPGLLSASGTTAVSAAAVVSAAEPSPQTATLSTAQQQQAAETASAAWQQDHPSALEQFASCVGRAVKHSDPPPLSLSQSNKHIAVFLDYDGTLSPIVPDPDKAFLSDAMRAAVREVAGMFPTAIISGRGREKVSSFVQLGELYYAGSHGLDIARGLPRTSSSESDVGGSSNSSGFSTPDRNTDDSTDENNCVLAQPALEHLALMHSMADQLSSAVKTIPGALVEHNTFTVSVHYRCVKKDEWAGVARAVQEIVAPHAKEIQITHGRKVLEIRPRVAWDKGKALEFLLELLGMLPTSSQSSSSMSSSSSSRGPAEVHALYIGDDRTDEDAFKVLRKRGVGHGILVSTVVKETAADFTLKDPSEVMLFLQKLVDCRRQQQEEQVDGERRVDALAAAS